MAHNNSCGNSDGRNFCQIHVTAGLGTRRRGHFNNKVQQRAAIALQVVKTGDDTKVVAANERAGKEEARHQAGI